MKLWSWTAFWMALAAAIVADALIRRPAPPHSIPVKVYDPVSGESHVLWMPLPKGAQSPRGKGAASGA